MLLVLRPTERAIAEEALRRHLLQGKDGTFAYSSSFDEVESVVHMKNLESTSGSNTQSTGGKICPPRNGSTIQRDVDNLKSGTLLKPDPMPSRLLSIRNGSRKAGSKRPGLAASPTHNGLQGPTSDMHQPETRIGEKDLTMTMTPATAFQRTILSKIR